MSVKVSADEMFNDIKSKVEDIDINNGAISNDALIRIYCNAFADAVNKHTHDFTYVGAGTGSSPQQGETNTP